LHRTEQLLEAKFLRRESRFSATVSINGSNEYVHVPSSGRMEELLVPGKIVYLKRAGVSPIPRKTPFTIVLTHSGLSLVSVEAAKANNLFEEALKNGGLEDFKNFRVVEREKRIGLSKIDFVIENPQGEKMFTEIKSVTLVENGRALFPDAPTTRGIKHLKELMNKSAQGISTAVVFVIQRSDADSFSPHDKRDPDFGKVLRQAKKVGVKLTAYKCLVEIDRQFITEPVPVIL
jgi:sugar fermentation stimulation protein A